MADSEFKKLLNGGRWASAATDNVDPDDSSVSPTLTRTTGFPSSYSASSGGVKPDRRRINQLFRELSGGAFEVRMGISPYDAEVNYPVNAITQVGGTLYHAALANGPGSTVVNPVGGEPTWVAVSGSISDPEAPRSILFDNSEANAMDVRWKAGRDGGSAFDNYDIQWRIVQTTTEDQWSPLVPLRIGYAQYTIGALSAGNQIQVRVRGITEQGEESPWTKSTISEQSNSTDRVRGGLPGGGDVIALVATQSVNLARLTWNAPADNGFSILRYYVQWRSTGAFNTSDQVISTPDLSEDISGLRYGIEWDFRVAAENAQGIGPWSNVATLTLADPNITTGQPTPNTPQVASRTNSSFSVNAQWTNHPTLATANPTSADWQWRTSGAVAWIDDSYSGLSGFSRSNLSAATSYEVRFRLNTTLGDTEWSPVASITTTAASPPGSPSNVSVNVSRRSGNNYNVNISFGEAAGNGRAIRAYYYSASWPSGPTQSGGSTSGSATGQNVRSFSFTTNLDPGTRVTVLVWANNGSRGPSAGGSDTA